MTDITSSYRDEIAAIACKLINYLKERKDEHYDIRPGAYAPQPYINIVTKDTDYADGTRLEGFLRIVTENCTASKFIWGVTGCKIIVETKSGNSIDAFGMKIQFNFFERKEEETK